MSICVEPVGGKAFCGKEVVVEKVGRSVCREHADKLKGTEYPVRDHTWTNDLEVQVVCLNCQNEWICWTGIEGAICPECDSEDVMDVESSFEDEDYKEEEE
jgi:hypothetical protein